MSRIVHLRLTQAEADAYDSAAENGVESGSLFVNDDGTSTGYGNGKRSMEAWERAYTKMKAAKAAAAHGKPTRSDAIYAALDDLFDAVVGYAGMGGECVASDDTLLAAARLLGRVRDAEEITNKIGKAV